MGASNDEVRRRLPGDDLVPRPKLVTTRAITIRVPADDVWPWLVQLGQGRGGFYSYDWLENLIGLDIHSSDRVVPDLQDLQVGDRVRLAPEDREAVALTVAQVEPGRVLVLHARDPRTGGPVAPGDPKTGRVDTSWALVLEPLGTRSTRLLIRWRADWHGSVSGRLFVHLLLEPANFLMEQKMLRGIRQRAERPGRQVGAPAA